MPDKSKASRIVNGNSTKIDPGRKVTPLFENHVSNNYVDGAELRAGGRSMHRLPDDAEFSKREVDIIQT